MVALLALAGLTSTLALAGIRQLGQTERQLLFRVTPGVASWYDGLPAGVQQSYVTVPADGASQRVRTWWWPAARAGAPAVLYLHGAKWNLTGQAFRIQALRRLGFSVFAIDYRGFGDSDGGLPSESSVYADAQAAWQRLAQLQPDASRRYIYGHSLGGAVAIDLAADLQAKQAPALAAHGLIIESTFTNLSDIARSYTYSWVPTQFILRQKFDSLAKIGRVGIPVLVVHGTEDRYVSPQFSESLYAAAAGRKELLMVEGANHNNSMLLGEEEYRVAMHDLFGIAPG
jgi:alpha-beta hydrolase superfamily lysophospholipase